MCDRDRERAIEGGFSFSSERRPQKKTQPREEEKEQEDNHQDGQQQQQQEEEDVISFRARAVFRLEVWEKFAKNYFSFYLLFWIIKIFNHR